MRIDALNGCLCQGYTYKVNKGPAWKFLKVCVMWQKPETKILRLLGLVVKLRNALEGTQVCVTVMQAIFLYL